MITAVYLENPFKPQNRVIRQISAAEAPAVIDAVALLNANLSGEMILSVNGQKVAADHALKDGDFVVIAPNVLGGGGGGGKNIAGIVAGIALMAFSGGAAGGLMGVLGSSTGTLGLGLALYFGGSLLMGNQKTPKIDVPRTPSAFEGGYGWSPNQIRLQPGSPMPITFGTFKTSGQLIARRVYSGDFAGRQTQFLSLLLAAGEGPIDSITDIEINDTPIASIQGATYETRLGANDQTPIPGIISSVVEFQAFSSEIPLSTTSWITKAQTEPGEKVMLDFVFPAGLYAVDTGSGATVDCEGVIRWQYREIGAVDWLAGSTHTSKEKVRRPNYVTMTFTPPDPAKLYEFRAQNRTLKHFQDKYGGVWLDYSEMPGNYSAAVSWVGLTVTSARKQSYPGVALVYINLPATENLSGSMPRVSWKQTRSNILAWNPSTEAYEQKDATNIAWMSYDLLHYCRLLKNIQTGVDERIVFGEPKENLNYAEFSAWAAFCAETAGDVSRGRGNALIDAPEQIWPVIQKIATSGRAFIIQQAGVFKPIWDAARNMSQIFTAGNIIDGSLSGSFLPERERASALEVSFYDEDNGCERTTLFVPGDDYNPAGLENPSQIFLPCITSSKAAYMWAKHQLKKNKYLKRTKSLQADIDSIVAELGDVVGIQSDITSWGVGGRIMGATTTSVVIDQAVTLAPGSTYSLLIRYPDNTLIRRVVDAVLVSTTTTTLNFTGAPWPTAPERYCVYSFGINTLETKPFQITGIRRNGDLQASLELLEYIEDVYTEATDFPVIDYTAANAGISSLTVKADSDTGKLGIAWTIPTDRDYTGSIVYIDGKPQGFFTTEQTGGEFDTTPGTHTVTVVPIGAGGRGGTETEQEITLGDPTLSAVSDISLTSSVRGQADGTNLVYITGTFTIPELANSVLVEIGEGSNPTSWATVQDSRVPSIYYGPVPPGALFTFRFTARNKYVTASPAIENINTVGDTTAPAAPSVTAVAYLKTVLVGVTLNNPPSDLAGFEIWRHTANDAGAASLVAKVAATEGRGSYTDQSPVYLTDLFYWARAVDKWGNKSGFGAAAATNVTHIKAADITADQITGKDFRTDIDVGETVDGVRFTAAGIEMWQGGIRKVFIPASGDPDFKGAITALAGYIGGWEIAEGYLQGGNIRLDSTGAVQTVDYVSGNNGWKADGVGDVEFNNIRSRGAIKTVVFEKNEISVVGGRTLIRPAGVVSVYNYAAYLQAKAQAHFDAAWTILCELLGITETAPDITVASYAEYLALDQAYYRDIATAMGFATYETGIDPAVYDDTAMQAYLLVCWAAINSTLGTTHDAPTFPAMTQAAFAAMEADYWNLAAEIIDNPPVFAAVIGANDCRVTLDDAEQFSVGDVVRMKDGLSGDYWGIISGISGNDVDMTFASGELFAITAGQAIVNYGPVNSGGVLLDGQAPMIDVYTHGGEPWNSTDIKVRIGNLRGWGTINHDVFGIAIGDPAGEYLIYDDQSKQLQLTGSINIVSARGIGNFSDAGALAGKDDIDLSYVTDAGTLAGVDDLDGVGDGTTYKKTTANEKSGGGRAYSGLDANNCLITAVIPATNIGTPAAAGLFLGKDFLGFYNAGWKTYMDNAGNFALIGGGTHGLSWNAETGVLTIAGSISILGGSGYGNLTDKPTSLSGISSTEGSKLAGIAEGADVTSANTAYDTARVAGVAAATVKDNAANAISQLNDISADNKLVPSEKHAARKEWDIIAAERSVNSTYAMNIAGFTIGIAEGSFNETASDAYWSQCWTKLNTLLGESNAEPAFPAQTFASFAAEEAGYYNMVRLAIDSEPVTVPPTPDVLALNTAYTAAFQALANYLNAGTTWSTGIPTWIADANINATTDIVGATFRATWKAYYDARTALLNAIAAKSKIIADLAQGAADTVSSRVENTLDANNRVMTAVIPKTAIAPTGAGLFLGANYLGYHDGADWKTYMDANGNFALDGAAAHGLTWNAATGTLTIAGNITVQDGAITAPKLATDAIKSTNYGTTAGSFLDLGNGNFTVGGSAAPVFSLNATAKTGQLAGFSFNATDMTSGSGSTAIGISTDTAKKAFWAGHATPASAPFFVAHDGTGKWGNFTLSESGFSSTYTGTPSYTTLMKSSDSGANCGFENTRTTTPTDYAKVEIRNGGIYLSALNAAGAKYISVNCSAATMVTIDCLDSSQTGIRINTGNIYIGNNCSALSFTDRTEMPESMDEALEIINTMQPTKGKVDYKRLSNKAKKITIQKAEDGSEYIEEGRDLTKTVSALIMVVQKLQEEIIRLSDRLAVIENAAPDEEREYIEAVDKVIGENRGNIRVRMEAGK